MHTNFTFIKTKHCRNVIICIKLVKHRVTFSFMTHRVLTSRLILEKPIKLYHLSLLNVYFVTVLYE